MKQFNKEIIYRFLYMWTSLFEILTLIMALMVYTSLNKSVPWYESSGAQFLAIPMIVIPILIVIGLLLYLLGRKYNIETINKRMPFYSAIVIFLPIATGSLNRIFIGIGVCISITLIIANFYLLVRHYKKTLICNK